MEPNWFPTAAPLLCVLFSEDETSEVVEDGENHKRKQEEHPNHLGAFHKLLARFATRDDFIKEEEDMAAVESGNGEDVDKGKHEGDESRQMPKLHPVPMVGEEASDCSEASYALCAVGREYVLEVADISAQNVPPMCEASGEALKESVGACNNRIVVENVVRIHPHEVSCIERELQGVELRRIGVLNNGRDVFQLLCFFDVAQ